MSHLIVFHGVTLHYFASSPKLMKHNTTAHDKKK